MVVLFYTAICLIKKLKKSSARAPLTSLLNWCRVRTTTCQNSDTNLCKKESRILQIETSAEDARAVNWFLHSQVFTEDCSDPGHASILTSVFEKCTPTKLASLASLGPKLPWPGMLINTKRCHTLSCRASNYSVSNEGRKRNPLNWRN